MSFISDYFLILFCTYYFAFRGSKGQLINNPQYIISDIQYPIIFNANNIYYNIISSGKLYSIEKSTNGIIYFNVSNSYIYSPPYFLGKNESDNYFLLANNIYYKVDLNINYQIQNLKQSTLSYYDENTEYIGYIKYIRTKIIQLIPLRVTNEIEIIIYGKKEKNINFCYFSTKNNFLVEIKENNLGKQISCKYIENEKYLCVYNSGHKIKIVKFEFIQNINYL